MSNYIERADVEDRFGVINVSRWADLDADANGVSIASRIERAIEYAEEYVDNVLRTSNNSFVLPLRDSNDAVHVAIKDICAVLAGYWLSISRGVADYDDKGNPITRLYALRNEAIQTLQGICKGEFKLEGVS